MNMRSHHSICNLAIVLFFGSSTLMVPVRLHAAVTNYQNLTIGPNGALIGGLGDVFNIRGNLINNSTQNTIWDTHLSQISFNASGPHQLAWTGAEQGRGNAGFVNNFAVGIFVLPSGASLTMSGGGALYTRVLVLGGGVSQIASISGGLNIHYNPGSPQNAYLNFQTYSLGNGYFLSPAAAPADFNAVWNGTAGNWTDATKWSGSSVPLNPSNSVTLYDATISSGTVTLNQTIGYIQKLNLGSGGTLTGANSVTPWDTFTWGTVGNNNPSTISGGAVVNANGDLTIVGDSSRNLDSATINNHAGYIATWAAGNSDLNFSNNAAFNNYGAFIVQNNRGLGHNGGTGTFNNYGTFTKNTGTGTTNIGSASFVFNNSGSIAVQTGTLEFDGPLVGPTSGSISVAAAASLVVADGISPFAGSIANAGPLNVGDAIGAANSAVLRLQVNNQINNSSILTVKSDGLLDVNGLSESVGALVVSSGTVSIGAGTLLPSSLSMTGGTISGAGAGNLQLSSDLTATSDGGGNAATIGAQIDLNGATRTFIVNQGSGAADLLVSGNVFNGGLTKAGLGAMTLSGTDSYTGATTVNGGKLTISGSIIAPSATVNTGGTLAFAGAGTAGNPRIVVNSGGTFDISQLSVAGLTVGSIEGAGVFRLGSRTLTFGSLATNTGVSGTVADGGLGGGVGGSIVKVGVATTTLSGTTSYTGSTAVNAGTLTIDGAAFSGSVTTVAPGALMSFINVANAGSGTFSTTGSANAGIAGGLIQFSGQGTTAGHGLFTNYASAAIAAGGGLTTFAGGASAGSGTFTNTGGGVNGAPGGSTQLSGSGTTAASGIFTSAGATFNGSPGGQTVFNSGAFGGTASITANGGTTAGAGGAQTIFNDGSTTDAALLTTNGGTNGGSGGLTETIGNVTGGSNQVVTNAGGTFDISQLSVAGITVGSIEGAGTFQLGSKTLTFGSLGTNKTVSGTIADGGIGGGVGGALVKVGAGMTTLSGASTYTGTTTINAGVLGVTGAIVSPTILVNAGTFSAGGAANVGNPRVVVNLGGIFDISGLTVTGLSVGSIEGAGHFQLGSKRLTFGSLGTMTAVSGLITDGGIAGGVGGALVKVGSGTTTFSGNNAYTGTTSVTAGTLQISGAVYPNSLTTVSDGAVLTFVSAASAGNAGFINNSGASGGQTDFSGSATAATGTFTNNGGGANGEVGGLTQFTGSGTTAASGVFTSGGASASGAAGGDTVFNSGATGGSASITANGGTAAGAGGGMTIFNDGSITAAALLTTSGGTNGGNGGLTETIGNVTGGTNQVVTNAGGTFDISQLSVAGITVGSIEGAGNFQLGSKTLTFGSLGTNKTVSGTIADGGIGGGIGGALVKVGAGMTTLSGASTYTGGTMLQAGGLNINSPTAIGSGLFSISGGTTIDNTTAAPLTLTTNNAQSWLGSFTFTGTKSLNFGTGAVTLNSGPFVTVSANVLTVGPIGNGTGNSITKLGAGTLYVNGGASYTGTTSVNAGTLTISGGPFASSASTVAAAATMNFVNAANAGSGTFANFASSTSAFAGGLIQFTDANTNAGFGTYTNNGGSGNGNGAQILFNSATTGDHATITNNGATVVGATASQLLFNAGSTAGNAVITTHGGLLNAGAGVAGAVTLFSGNATAGAATLVTDANGGTFATLPGLTEFKDTARSGTAHITINSDVNSHAFNKWINSATAESATITVNGGSTADFENSATAGESMVVVNVGGLTTFINSAMGGSAIVTNNAGSQTQFHNMSNAASANITNMDALGGQGTAYTRFFDTATAGTATITNRGGQQQQSIGGGHTEYHNSSSAGSAMIANLGATDSNGAYGGETDFYDSSNAGANATTPATIVNGGSTAGGTNGFGGNGGFTQFFNATAAGTARITNNPAADNGHGGAGGYTYFNSGTSADHATITNNGSQYNSSSGITAGHTIFNTGSTAASATLFTNGALASIGYGGEIDFNPGSSAANATITNNGAAVSGAPGGSVQFNGQTGNPVTAGSALITVNGGAASGAKGAFVYFGGSSNAANAVITTNGGSAGGAFGGVTEFQLSSAGAATLITNGGTNGGAGGTTEFISYFGINPDGGTARVVTNAGGIFDKSNVSALTVGSIEGAGRYQLGGGTLASGSLNTNTSVSGLIVDGGLFGGSGAGLIKQGTGTLMLTGANTYTGATTVNAGTLGTNLLANGGLPSGIGASDNSAASLILNGGTFQYTGPTISTNRLFTLTASGGVFDASGAGPVTFNNAGAIAFSGSGPRTLTLTGSNTGGNTLIPVVGDGTGGATSLAKTGSGTWVLNTINAYTGPTTITAGTLRYGSSDIDPATNIQAYTLSPANPTPNWNYGGSLGLDFNVNSGKTITITQLGLFAASTNSTPYQFSAPHTVYVYQRNDNNNTGTVLTSLNLSASAWNAAPLSADGYRFVSLPTPLTLAAGTYSIVAEAFGTDKYYDLSSTTNLSNASAGTMNTGLGSLTFVGDSRYGSTGSYPRNAYFWPFAYGAGSFDYTLNNVPAVGRIPGDVIVNGPTAVLDLGNNQTGYVGTVTLDGNGSIIGTGTSRLTSRNSFQMKSGTVTAILAGSGIPLVKTTAGTVTLSGASTYSGNDTVSAGTLKFNITSGTPTVAAGVTATVASGATLELAGSVSALGSAGGNRVHVVNDSSIAGVVVSGTNQIVGGIDGIGTTQISAGSDLTANHIIQSALIIGGASGSPGFLTIDASDSSGNPLGELSAQSSGTILAGSLASGDSFGTGLSSANSTDGLAGSGSGSASIWPTTSPMGAGLSAVPEPSAIVLSGFALAGLLIHAISRRPYYSRTKPNTCTRA